MSNVFSTVIKITTFCMNSTANSNFLFALGTRICQRFESWKNSEMAQQFKTKRKKMRSLKSVLFTWLQYETFGGIIYLMETFRPYASQDTIEDALVTYQLQAICSTYSNRKKWNIFILGNFQEYLYDDVYTKMLGMNM